MSILLFIYKPALLCKKSGLFLRGYFPGNTFVMLRTQSASTRLTSCSFKLCVYCVSVCTMYMRSPQGSEEELNFWTGVSDDCELPPCGCWEPTLGPPQEQPGTTESSLQSHSCLFIFLKTRTINEPVCTSAWLCHTHPCLHWEDSLLGSTRNQSKDERPRTHAAILTWQSDGDYLEPDPNDLWHFYTDS